MICDEVLASALREQIQAAGSTCEQELDKAIKDADDFDLEVDDVTIDGDQATAKVTGKADGKDEVRDFEFVREGGPGGGDASGESNVAEGERERTARLAGETSYPSRPVLPFVVGAVVAGADRLPPGRVVAVPADRAVQALVEAHRGSQPSARGFSEPSE